MPLRLLRMSPLLIPIGDIRLGCVKIHSGRQVVCYNLEKDLATRGRLSNARADLSLKNLTEGLLKRLVKCTWVACFRVMKRLLRSRHLTHMLVSLEKNVIDDETAVILKFQQIPSCYIGHFLIWLVKGIAILQGIFSVFFILYIYFVSYFYYIIYYYIYSILYLKFRSYFSPGFFPDLSDFFSRFFNINI